MEIAEEFPGLVNPRTSPENSGRAVVHSTPPLGPGGAVSVAAAHPQESEVSEEVSSSHPLSLSVGSSLSSSSMNSSSSVSPSSSTSSGS
jgi:hypothetical protein